MSQFARARLGVTAGCTTAAIGAGLQWGLGIGLLLAGVAVTAWSLVMIDVDEEASE